MAAWGRLRVLDGAHEGTVFVLEGEVHTLGRGQASDFRLGDPTVSRVQAEFRNAPEGMRISGLSEKNPVWLNGEPVGRGRPIAFGDKVQCGLVHLVFEDLPAPAAPRADGKPATAGLAFTTGGLASMDQIPAAPASPAAAAKGPACGRCGSREAPGARFCGACGAALGGSGPIKAISGVTRVSAPKAESPEEASLRTMQVLPPKAPAPAPASPRVPEKPPRTDSQGLEAPPPLVRTDTMARPPEALDGLESAPRVHASALPPAAGSTLKGRFELRRHIAHGRVTEVYEAFDREIKGPVTVKVLLPALAADLDVRDWFFHAANALIVAAHPSLLRVHSVHESGNTCFAVTDFLYGVPLRDQIRSRPASMGGYDPAEVRRVGTALCEGLTKLHEVGPHGDVVPGNVWVDPQGKVILLDAGLSTVPGKSVRWPPSSDLASAVYSAPEVLRGAPPDARSDLYSVGAVLYHMLTAELPAGRIPPVATARPGLPSDLAAAVDRAMAPRPEDRFASAKEMHSFLTGEIETRRRTGLRKRTIAAAAAALLLGVGFSSAWWFPPAESWRRRNFADPAAVALAERSRAEARAAEAALVPLAEFTSPPNLEGAREAMRRGGAAEGEWKPETAHLEYARAASIFKVEEAAARDAKGRREEAARRAGARILELETAIGRVAPSGEFLGAAAEEFRRRAAEAAPPAGPVPVLASLEIAERRGALDETARKAADLRGNWEAFAADGDAVRRARRDLEEARAILAEGKAAKAETAAREGNDRLRRAVGDRMESLLAGLCTAANLPRPAEYAEAEKALGNAVFNGSREDDDGAAAAFNLALAGFEGVLGKELEALRASVEAREAARRCPSCAGTGECRECSGTGQARVPCPACAGKGVLDAPCPRCDPSGLVPCGKCAAGVVQRTCEACAGAKSVPCTVCKGAPPPCSNPNCKAGKVPCLWCKNGVITAAGPDKGKPCTHGCSKGWNECPRCHGKGTAPCTACSGTGAQPCAACGGKGTRPFPCDDCSGKGKVPCPDCGGTRTIHPDCPRCEEGAVISTCPSCSGKKACPACGGRGRKE